MKRGLYLLLGLCLSIVNAPAARADIRYATPSGLTSGACTSWGSACTLAYALTQTVAGDQVWVAAGVHTPSAAVDRAASFALRSGVALYGGFDGSEGDLDERDWDAHVTVLSGDLGGDDTTDANGVVLDWPAIVNGAVNNVYHVVKAESVTGAVLDGFTITAGYADFAGCEWAMVGGGLFPTFSTLTLANLVFRGNQAGTASVGGCGGAVYFYEGSSTLTDVAFIGNGSNTSGGMYLRSPATATLTRVRFENNDAFGGASVWGVGGGLRDDGGNTLTLTDVDFVDNIATYSGGGASISSAATVNRARFEGNTSGEAGGGLYEDGGCTLTDVQFVGNSAFRTPASSGGSGGGAYHHLGNSTYERVTFEGNSSHSGGALRSDAGAVTVIDTKFVGNHADVSGGGGGALFVYGGELLVTNAEMRDNTAYCGGAVFVYTFSGFVTAAVFTNVSASANSGSSAGCGYAGAWYAGTLRNGIFWGNGGGLAATSVAYSIVEGGCPGGATCDHVGSGNPQFVDAAGGDLRLQGISPAIDAGDNEVTSPSLPGTDLLGNARRVDIPGVANTGHGTAPIVDMGAYEYTGGTPVGLLAVTVE